MCGATPPRGVWGYAPIRKFRGRSRGSWGPKRLAVTKLHQKMNYHDFWGGGRGGTCTSQLYMIGLR